MQKKSKKLPPTSTFHIYFRFEESFNSKIEILSSEIYRSYNSEFVADGKSYVPHLTLYIFAAPLRNTKMMINNIQNISEEIMPPALTIDKMLLSHDGWIMLDFKNADKITVYHEKIVEAVNPLREGILRKKYRDDNELLKYPKHEIESLKKYGERHAIENFHPHLSLARIKNVKEAEKAFEIYKNSLTGLGARIVSLDFVKTIGDESGGRGKLLFRHDFILNHDKRK